MAIKLQRAGLRRILDDLGSTLLELIQGDPDAVPEVCGIAIHDPLDPPFLPPTVLVLGVGVGSVPDILALLGDLAGRDVAGLVLRSGTPIPPEVIACARQAGVALLGLTRGATWAQLAAMLRSLLAQDDIGSTGPESLGGLPSGDLFALANAIAALLDAPLTIEDRSNRVIAFSGRQDQTDQGRIETVLGLQVPERYARVLSERGVFGELYRSQGPVMVDPVSAEDDSHTDSLPRAAIAVRAGDELLGSIWVVLDRPLDADRSAALEEASKLVALHLLRERAGADVERRLRADLVSTALEGGAGAREALNQLELADRHLIVLAVSAIEADNGPESARSTALLTSDRQRLSDVLWMHLTAIHPHSATALLGRTVYALLPVADLQDDQWALRVAKDFVDRTGDRLPAIIGIGPVAADVDGLAHARSGADRALRVVRETDSPQRVARLSDVYITSLVFELRDSIAARGDALTGPVARLMAYDDAHDTNLVDTLRAWLDAFGDVGAASSTLFVHPNTFRYRLRRLSEVGQLDLDDPDARFAALLQLRLIL
ncbi:PucR family transcriptional regulator [Allobranchiibius sp. GilTou38]|uniref:helix-turn-helix domain-containing protein n=1 Tax=Allobranchiibius sp. GilTou38 TaxID=2815210 RepID=UPI001AA1582E|nr:helix-turn-helix domain-containing protein [Allobranchiibius sp. GilTou38]